MGITREELYRDILLELLRFHGAEGKFTVAELSHKALTAANKVFPKEGVKYGEG